MDPASRISRRGVTSGPPAVLCKRVRRSAGPDGAGSRPVDCRARGGLPERQAVALVLRHSGFSYVEVAAALDLSPGSVGTTLRRAESALRKELNRHVSSD